MELDTCPDCWREHPENEPCMSLALRVSTDAALLARQAAQRLTTEALADQGRP
jgi:hypothetical protein